MMRLICMLDKSDFIVEDFGTEFTNPGFVANQLAFEFVLQDKAKMASFKKFLKYQTK